MRQTFTNLQNLCAAKGIVCERAKGKIELTTPDGGTTAECGTLAEALDTLHNDSTFAGLPIKLAKTGWQREMEAEAREALRVTPLDHLRAIAREMHYDGDKEMADVVLKRVQQAEAERAALVLVAKAAQTFVQSCESGEVRSVKNQAMFRSALKNLAAVRSESEVAK